MKEFFRKIGDLFSRESQPADEDIEAYKQQVHQESIEFAAAMLTDLYISGEARLGEHVNTEREIAREYPHISPEIREQFSRMRFETQGRTGRFQDQLMNVAEEGILGRLEIDDETRAAIKLQAITAARDYWEERLRQPDLTADEMVMGSRRLTQLNSLLEQISRAGEDVDQEE